MAGTVGIGHQDFSRSDLFEGLSIWQHESFVKALLEGNLREMKLY